MHKRLIFFIIAIQISISGIAQIPFLRIHQLFMGKEEYNVQVIHQDLSGMIWFGTDKGLFRFDGITLEAFTVSDGLADNSVSAICCTPDGTIWIGHTSGDITVYNGMEFRIFQPEEGMGKVEITDIVVDPEDIIWYSTMGEGIYRYNGRHLSNLNSDDGLSDNYVYDIEVDSTNGVWLATDYGISRYLNDTFRVISMKDGLIDNLVKCIYAADTILWIGTDEAGFSSFNTRTNAITNFGAWEYGAITGILETRADNLWIATERQGVIQVMLRHDTITNFNQITESQGLTSNRIHTIMKDFEENIWVGATQGVVQALPPLFEFLDPATGTPFQMAYSLLQDASGSLWVCTELGLYRGYTGLSGSWNWESISERMHIDDVSFISLYLDVEHNIWAGTYGRGVYRIDPENLEFTVYNNENGLSDNDIIHITGPGNKIWISSLGGGVCSYDLQDHTFKQFNSEELYGSYVYCTHVDQTGRVWLAGSLDHPYYIEGDSVFQFEDTTFTFPQLYGIAVDSAGDLWFNTLNQGVIMLSGVDTFSVGQQEEGNLQEVQSIAFDKFNNLLVFANNGLEIRFPESGTRMLLDENTGMGYRYPLLNSVFQDREKNIWFGTETGIIKYNPEYLSIARQMPHLFISTSNLFGDPIDRNRTRYRYRSNNFTFGYTGIWYKNPELMSYRYMLEGYDLDWNYYNRNRVIPYPKLPPADYTFKVEVSIDGINWIKPDEAIYAFTISPPFWRRWWFIISVAGLLILGVFLYIRRRVANLERTKKELETEVRKRTEQIRNKSMVLELQKEEIEAQRDLAEEQRDQIEVQNNEIQSSIRYAHKIQSAALPPKKVVDDLLADYFIFNRPRDIVSGDFYWVASIQPHLIFSVGDCTGHGVPGAFMSMLGISALNDIIKSLGSCKAATILDLLRERIRESLHQTADLPATSSDGMDISICIYEPNTRELQFSGAHNPLYLIRDQEITIIPADKQDIGSRYHESQSFTNHQLKLETGDCLYLFSDGFPDQFGGPDFKKYKYKRFREFLISISRYPMDKQSELLGNELAQWMGHHPQIDDIIVMGVRV